MGRVSVCAPEQRPADAPRGPNSYPHWHDSPAWAKKATLTRKRFLAMTPAEFANWVFETFANAPEELEAFFFGQRWPEGLHYATSRVWLIHTCYPALKRHRDNWPAPLLDTWD